jgi:hypothetical protein
MTYSDSPKLSLPYYIVFDVIRLDLGNSYFKLASLHTNACLRSSDRRRILAFNALYIMRVYRELAFGALALMILEVELVRI